MLGKVSLRYIDAHMKRLDLHPITYGILSLQYTERGPRARPRYSKRTRTDPTQDGTVCTERRTRGLAVRGPLPAPPSPAFQNYSSDPLSQVCGLRLIPGGVGFFTLVCV